MEEPDPLLTHFTAATKPTALERAFWSQIGDARLAGVTPMERTYTDLFWRAYLGDAPYALWGVLCSLLWYVEANDGRWPPIKTLAELMGQGATRFTILGRKAFPSRPAQEGAIDVLQRENLIYYWTEGDTRHLHYYFSVETDLPLLTPNQAGQLTKATRKLHQKYLAEVARIDPARWGAIAEASLVLPFVVSGKR